jgi:bacterial leucyl aminopeptidase
MNQNHFKYKLSKAAISCLAIIIFYSTGCSKEEYSGKPSKDELTILLRADISADTLESTVNWMQNMGTRFALASNRREIALKIKNRFIMIGYPKTTIDSFIVTKLYNNTSYVQWQYNVIAALEGISSPDSICILGGHYDNILRAGTGDPFVSGLGANDNASGVAAALEIARVLKKNNFSPKNTIKFIAFASEEIGLMGSYYQSEKSKTNSEKIKMMLNNDMIGYQPFSDRTQWYINILDYENSHELRKKAEFVAGKYAQLNYVNINTYNKQSDSYPYSLNGFRSLFFMAYTSDPNYHTPNDIVQNCNFAFCREVAIISCALLVDCNY